MFDLTGKLALVTGCRRGIGLAMTEALAGAGADIIGVSQRLETGDSEVRRRVEAAGRSFRGYRVDLSQRSELAGLIREIDGLARPLDILVNNAGTIVRSPAVSHGDAAWDTVIETNLSAPFMLTRDLGRRMVERGAGKIIFTASLLSFQGGVLVPGYTAAKSGILGLVRAFANEWAAHGVNVNAIAPGYVETDNTEALRNDPQRAQAILQRIPAGRWSQPGDLAGPTVFLAAPASDYMHGSVVTVDGGWLGR